MRPQEASLALIGVGTMGRGIARTAARAGLSVTLYDIDPTAARATVEGLDGLDGERPARVEGSIEDAVHDSDVVIECVPEVLSIKTPALETIRKHARHDALLATNTSTMSIAALGELAGCADRLLGLHFFNPVEKMRLVEVVRAPSTPAEVVDRGEALADRLGKTPIVVNDAPGFVSSRLGLALGNEAMLVLQSGIASASAIDAAMRLGYNHPMGPLELADLVGLDARLNNLRTLQAARGDDRFEPPQILLDLVAAGRLGCKTGVGFYRYDEHGARLGEAPLPGRDSASAR